MYETHYNMLLNNKHEIGILRIFKFQSDFLNENLKRKEFEILLLAHTTVTRQCNQFGSMFFEHGDDTVHSNFLATNGSSFASR